MYDKYKEICNGTQCYEIFQSSADKHINYEPFDQMLKFRQNEAKRCILVKLCDMKHISDFENFCKCYVTIVNIFPYYTANNNNFVLMELRSIEDVQHLRDIAVFRTDVECVQSVTPLFSFTSRNKICPITSTKDISIYSNFKTLAPNKIDKSLEQIDSVSDQMIALYNCLKITDLDIRLRFYTANEISYYLTRLFPNICVVPFGSSVNGFGQIGCDLDLLCKPVVSNNKKINWRRFLFLTQNIPLAERNEQKEFLETVGTVMKLCIPGISDVKKILGAQVPIIKFYNVYTNMKCDLSSTNLIALHMSELLYTYGQLDWRIKPLVYTIRKWARVMNLTKEQPGHWITNFSLTLLIIFYLQVKDILPSVNTIKCFVELSRNDNDAADPNFNWFESWKKSIKRTNNEDLHNLLFNFFEYYSIFDFKTQAICIRDGRYKPKNDFSPLYIYNPFNTTLNVSKNVTSCELIRLVDCLQKAFNTMLNSSEKDVISKLINLEAKTKRTQIRPEEKLLPTVTNIKSLKKIQGNIIK
ncbi:poly(A) RNA polymerase, mitochondrial isoform X3 [Bombus impatiens]|uniref:Poly(A) RNA polymerase, mitochondrial isoform X3 n=1 Tax=Bombus impatiens TaxID=132113 RepID=A0A6P8LD31_BOMIM|nr:poly(A) RNA polymerase, mitochondrial isoform X3 [Bombus impatiens]